MKNIKINKKILFILIFAFIVILLKTSNVFATTIPDSVMSKNETVGYNQNNIILYNNSNGYYYILYLEKSSNSESSWKLQGTNSAFILDPTWQYYYYITYNTNNVWSSPARPPDGSGTGFKLTSNYEVLWSKYDIVYYQRAGHTDGEVFFQAPPVVQEPVLEGTLAPIVAEIPETREVLQEIIALLPMILSVLVSLLALRKALRILVTFLRTS